MKQGFSRGMTRSPADISTEPIKQIFNVAETETVAVAGTRRVSILVKRTASFVCARNTLECEAHSWAYIEYLCLFSRSPKSYSCL